MINERLYRFDWIKDTLEFLKFNSFIYFERVICILPHYQHLNKHWLSSFYYQFKLERMSQGLILLWQGSWCLTKALNTPHLRNWRQQKWKITTDTILVKLERFNYYLVPILKIAISYSFTHSNFGTHNLNIRLDWPIGIFEKKKSK